MPGRPGEPDSTDAGKRAGGLSREKEERKMWITMDQKEKTVSDLKCIAISALCAAVLLLMMICG